MLLYCNNFLIRKQNFSVISLCVLPIVVRSQSISGVSAINLLVAFYDIHGRKGEVVFFFLSRTPHDTMNILLFRDTKHSFSNKHI
jgi:hypothetical protein